MEHTQERILPSAGVSLMVNLFEDEFRTYHGPGLDEVRRTAGAALAGPNTRASVIDTTLQRKIVTVRFRPGAAARFFASPLADAADRVVSLDDLWGVDGRDLRGRLLAAPTRARAFAILEEFLLRHLASTEPPDPLVPAACRALAHGLPVAHVAHTFGLSPKTFTRRFRAGTGVAPKMYARVCRLQRLLRSVRPPYDTDWAGLAAEHGFADQAHLTHDFRDLTGLTPGAYRPRRPWEQNHVPVPSRPSSPAH